MRVLELKSDLAVAFLDTSLHFVLQQSAYTLHIPVTGVSGLMSM